MKTPRALITLIVTGLLAAGSSTALAQDHGAHRMGPEIVIPNGAL